MTHDRHLLINGLSIGSGGGYTVARELMRHIALSRPGWTVTLVLTSGRRFHHEMKDEDLPANCRLLWAPPATTRYFARMRYEASTLVEWASDHGVSAALQLNGMIIKGMKPPTFAHFQDPMPYRPEAWQGHRERLIAMMKRRSNRRALRRAAATGYTSGYLRDLICGYHGVTPKRSGVFYNGIPDEWIARASTELPDWSSRPLDLVSVSNVSPYKRQELVIRTLPRLVERPGLGELKYRIIGNCPPAYKETLTALAQRLGVGEHVVVEGHVSDARVQQAMSTARCYVLMSVCESFGIPAIEAMSFGTPVVTSDCCAMPEVCGDAAELCPMDDVEALADRLEVVLTDATVAERLRRAGAEQVKRFSWSETAARMADCLEEIAADA